MTCQLCRGPADKGSCLRNRRPDYMCLQNPEVLFFCGQACALVEPFFAGGSRDALLQFLDGTQDKAHHPAPRTASVAEMVARWLCSTTRRDFAGLNSEWRQVVEVMDSGESGERALDALVLQVATPPPLPNVRQVQVFRR